MVLDDLGGGGEERLVGAPAHQRVAVVRGRRGVPHEGGRHVPAARNARVEGLRGRMDKLSETNKRARVLHQNLARGLSYAGSRAVCLGSKRPKMSRNNLWKFT